MNTSSSIERNVHGTPCIAEETDDEQNGDQQEDGDKIVHVLPLVVISQLSGDSH